MTTNQDNKPYLKTIQIWSVVLLATLILAFCITFAAWLVTASVEGFRMAFRVTNIILAVVAMIATLHCLIDFLAYAIKHR